MIRSSLVPFLTPCPKFMPYYLSRGSGLKSANLMRWNYHTVSGVSVGHGEDRLTAGSLGITTANVARRLMVKYVKS